MSDTPLTITDVMQTDNETSYNVGDLRRAYAFSSSRLSKLAINTDPLFRILTEKRLEAVDETIWKITEERPFIWKRYAYAVGFKIWTGSGSVPTSGYTEDDDLVGGSLTPQTQGSYMALEFKYLWSGNKQDSGWCYRHLSYFLSRKSNYQSMY